MIRTIVKADKQLLTFQVPAEFIGKEVEIIAFTIDEPQRESKNLKERTFTSIKTKEYKFNFNRDELNER